jgi:hypothetical protein
MNTSTYQTKWSSLQTKLVSKFSLLFVILCSVSLISSRAAQDSRNNEDPLIFAYCFGPDLTPGLAANCVNRLGVTASKDGHRRFGFSTQICILQQATEKTVEYVNDALRAADETGAPVVIRLMGDRFWDNRPELWNWWAPDQPGYNPENINNVEWYGWGKEKAVKMTWVKWGPTRWIPLTPGPNLASPAFIASNKKELDVLVPIIVKWYRNLPENRKYLFGGLVFGWEMQADHLGAFYAGHETEDIFSWKKRPETDRPETIGAPLQLGFAAATTLGLQGGKGATLRDDTVASIMRYYFDSLADIAVAHGIPPHKIMLHGVGSGIKNHGTLLKKHPEAIPGWSTYNAQPLTFDYIIDSRGDQGWNAIEFGGIMAIDRLENYYRHGCKVINLYHRDAHRAAINNRTVRQWLGYPEKGNDPLTLPYTNGFEADLKGWTGCSEKWPIQRSNKVACKGTWSLFTGPNCAGDLVFFDEPRPAIVEYYFLNSLEPGASGLADFRGDGDPRIRLNMEGGFIKCQNVGAKTQTILKLEKGWHQVRSVFDGKEAKIFVDGKLFATDPGMAKVREMTVGMYWNLGTGLYWDDFSVSPYEDGK